MSLRGRLEGDMDMDMDVDMLVGSRCLDWYLSGVQVGMSFEVSTDGWWFRPDSRLWS